MAKSLAYINCKMRIQLYDDGRDDPFDTGSRIFYSRSISKPATDFIRRKSL